MKFLLLILTLLLSSVLPAGAQKPLRSVVDHSIFMVKHEAIDHDPDGDGRVHTFFGTAFCVPGSTTNIMTAAHVVGMDNLRVQDPSGVDHEVKAVLVKDEKKDVAVLMLEDPLCELSSIQFARQNAGPGDEVWLYGYGLGLMTPLMTHGIISTPQGAARNMPNHQFAQLNALHGHSGAPVFDKDYKVVGMEVGGVENGDEIDTIIPVDVLRKVLR